MKSRGWGGGGGGERITSSSNVGGVYCTTASCKKNKTNKKAHQRILPAVQRRAAGHHRGGWARTSRWDWWLNRIEFPMPRVDQGNVPFQFSCFLSIWLNNTGLDASFLFFLFWPAAPRQFAAKEQNERHKRSAPFRGQRWYSEFGLEGQVVITDRCWRVIYC